MVRDMYLEYRLRAASFVFLVLLLPAFLPSTLAVPLTPAASPTGWYDHWACDRDRNRVEDRLDAFLKGESSPGMDEALEHGYIRRGSFPLFVDYGHDPTAADVRDLEHVSAPGRVTYTSHHAWAVAIEGVGPGIIDDILGLDGVVMVEYQGIFVPLLDTSVRAIKAEPSDEYSPETAWEYEGGYKGDGITVAILDTGVDNDHPALRGKYVAGVDFTDPSDNRDGTSDPDDTDGHGTHCAGIVMSAGNADGTHKGVAPDASLVDLKVLQDWGTGGHLLEGIDWCTSNKDAFSIDVLSISVGEIGGGDDDGNGANARGAQSAVDAGLVVVAAIGNDGNDHVGISQPASADNVIAVGAVDDMDTIDRSDDTIADFSQSGPRRSDGDADTLDELKPDVVAPGVGIDSTSNSKLKFLPPTGDVERSGTSMACPHVAGLCALMLQANPALSPVQVQNTLRLSSEPRGTVYYQGDEGSYSKLYGFGMIDAYDALKKGAGDYQEAIIGAPSEGAYVHGSYTVRGMASDLRGSISKVEVSVQDGSWEQASGTENWTYIWDTTPLSNGGHTIKVRSTNDRGSISQTVSRGCIINNILTTITHPSQGAEVSGQVVVEGTLEGLAVDMVRVGIDSSGYVNAVDYSPGADWSLWKATLLLSVSSGQHTLDVQCLSQGEWRDSGSVGITIPQNSDGASGSDGTGTSFLALPEPALVLVALVVLGLMGFRRRE